MKALCFATLALFTFAPASYASSVLADWSFETSKPTTAGPISPEIGNGSASGNHVTYTSPGGNGSAQSYSTAAWATGDYFQFTTGTTNFTGVSLSWDQTSSSTGPGQFVLQYSTDGVVFTPFGSAYSVLANASPNPVWSNTTAHSEYTFNFDLSAITVLNNKATVTFRLVDNSLTSAGGGTVGGTGTDRVDNFKITADSSLVAVPLPNAALSGLGLLSLLGLCRSFAKFKTH